MPRIIFKCPYIKPGTEKAATHLGNYVRYVATRDGVEKLTPDQAVLPATKKQQAMVERLLRDFPQSHGMFEYEDYKAAPTRAAASEFISRAIEDYGAPAEAQRSGFGGERRSSEMSELSPQGGGEGYGACDDADQIAKRENYVGYIAQRPRAERIGAHGLFNGTDDTLVLSKIAEEVANHPGNVWLPIISLRREDAARLGYDSAKQWQALLSAYAPQIAEAMKIPWNQFRWYASYHDEGTHPHVHMVCYSADGRSGFLDENGIARIKSGLAKNIFRRELTELYRQQTQRRDELVRKSGEVMEELIRQMRSGTLDNPRIERLTGQLAERLKCAAGKKQYGYLSVSVKAVVNEIVDELAKDARVAAAYDLWYSLREEVLRTYRDDLPQRLPLSQQKEFKQIKNLVIEEAVRLGRYTEIFDPTDGQEMMLEDTELDDTEPENPDDRPLHDTESDRDMDTASVYAEQSAILGNPYAKYRAAKRILASPFAAPEQTGDAVMRLTQAAEAGLDHAQYALGRLYLDGGVVERDTTLAVIWLSRAAEQGNPQAMYVLGKLNLEAGNHPAALRWFQRTAEQGNPAAQYQLSKLLLNGENIQRDAESAIRWLTESAEHGNQFAQYALGKLYLLGKDVPQDHEAAVHWLTLAAGRGNPYAQFYLEHAESSPSLFTCATRLLHHMGNIFQEQTPPSSGGVSFVDSKLRREIREKKIAMGHKPDDHENPEIAPRQI